MHGKSKTGRPKSRKIDDSVRPASEKGLPEGEIRYYAVYNKDQLQKVKSLAMDLALKSNKSKVGSVPPVQFKNLINEALNDLLKKYERKNKIRPKATPAPGRAISDKNQALLRKYFAENNGK